jgi:4-hydroxyacetophenone monooxygenase
MANPTIDDALAQAHLPALLMSLIHLTGDAGLLTQERRPVYDMVADPALGGFSEAVQSDIRTRARIAVEAHLAGAPLPPPPSPATVQRMMDWIAGVDIPTHYAPFLTDELQLTGLDTKAPDWSAPNLRAAAKTMTAVVIGAGMSGVLAGIRLQQAGIDFTILEKNADAGGTWFENTYPGCRVDNPNHMYSYSFEPNHDFPQYYSTQPVLLDYFKRIVAKYDLRKKIRFGTEVESAAFDEKRAVWRVTIKTSGEVLEASVLITAVGQLNRPRFPDIDRDRRQRVSIRPAHRARGRPPRGFPAHAAVDPSRAELSPRCPRGKEVAARACTLLWQMVSFLAVLATDRRLL